MKTKIFSFGIVALLSFVMAVPTLAASNSYGFSMSAAVVDGSKNGEYHTLNKGTAKIDGSHYVSSSRPGALTPSKVTYQLWNKTSGNSFGKVTATPDASGSKNFSGSYSGLGGGSKYYLIIMKGDDGRTVKGSGKISN
ncbi:hypothetical protein ACFY5J_07520 [Peribacillus butanolivorans]|uniref:hypothetical protein n=1 Tax=Peribacillus butanolivorans TaxID=421767 RepID=UPI00362577D6